MEIKTSDGQTVDLGNKVYFIHQDPFNGLEEILHGEITRTIRNDPILNIPALEVTCNEVTYAKTPSEIFFFKINVTKKLLDRLSKKIDWRKEDETILEEQLYLVQNEIGRCLITIHKLKKEIEDEEAIQGINRA